MDQKYAEWIFDSLMGSLTQDHRCNEVEDLFEEGKPCAELYEKMLDAYWRLCARLGQADEEEDADGEIIINSLLDITKIVGMKMFEYGERFSKM